MINLKDISNELSDVSFSVMEHAGYQASLMEAERLRGEGIHGLPSGTPIPAIPSSCLPGVPKEWVDCAGSYVIPVDTEVGLWFNWTMNEQCVGVVPSVKGMNPITGWKIDELRLEHYRDKCPIHGVALSHNRYCDKCGYNLPPQNMVSYPNTLWWDGYRNPTDGTVRQFFFTDEDRRDVASIVIGKKNTVPAFGFAFFRTKKERFLNYYNYRGYDQDGGFYYSDKVDTGVENYVFSTITSSNSITYRTCMVDTNSSISDNIRSLKSTNSVSKDVSVGAGAIIKQDLEVDTYPLDDWHEKPQAIIRIYFVFKDQLEKIVKKGGIESFNKSSKGFLEEVPVG